MSLLSSKHFISLKDTPKEDIMMLLETGISFKEVLDRPIKKVPALNGINILNLFFENSTRIHSRSLQQLLTLLVLD